MADGTGKKLYENGGRDLTPEGWGRWRRSFGVKWPTEAGKKHQGSSENTGEENPAIVQGLRRISGASFLLRKCCASSVGWLWGVL